LTLIDKYKCNLKTLLRQGITHPEFYGDVIYKLRNIIGNKNFHILFVKRIKKYIKRDYDRAILQRTARLVVNPSTVDNYAVLFACAATVNT